MIAEAKTALSMSEGFFSATAFYVEEHRGSMRRNTRCRIYDANGIEAGTLTQEVKLSAQFWRIFVKTSLLPFHFELRDTTGKMLAVIHRGWTLVRSRIEIRDGNGNVIGFLKHKYRSRKPRVKIFNAEGKKISEIAGTQGSWDMSIIDRDYQPFGEIVEYASDSTPGDTKGKETYHIRLNRDVLTGDERVAVLSAAIAIDRLLLESE